MVISYRTIINTQVHPVNAKVEHKNKQVNHHIVATKYTNTTSSTTLKTFVNKAVHVYITRTIVFIEYSNQQR